MPPVYVDTGIWVALLDAADQHHDRAKRIIQDHQAAGFVSSDLVVGEAVTLLRRSAGPKVAADFARDVLDHQTCEMVRTEETDWRKGMDLLEQYKEHRLSSTDAASFALIRRLDIKKVASFDKHFQIVLTEREVIGA